MKNTQEVHPIFNGKKQIAIIDNTDGNRIIVILIDKPKAYKQVFFVEKNFKQLVEDTRQMRDLGLASF
jgi:hypothetical protein